VGGTLTKSSLVKGSWRGIQILWHVTYLCPDISIWICAHVQVCVEGGDWGAFTLAAGLSTGHCHKLTSGKKDQNIIFNHLFLAPEKLIL